jgi:hypothetical protein
LNWKETNLPLDGAYLPGSDAAMIRVVANDGLNFTTVDSPPFQVPKHPPMVKIVTDPEDEPWQEGTPNNLVASASDIEDGWLPDHVFQWSSSQDGLLGQVRILYRSLSAGTHTITVTATDADQQTAKAETTITVAEKPPEAKPWWLYLITVIGVLFGLVGAVSGAFLLLKPAENTLAALQVEGSQWRARYLAGQVDQNTLAQIQESLRAYDRQKNWWSFDPFNGQ